MAAYNRLNGVYCSEHPWLLDEVLKREWGFDGFVISDWYGTHSTAAAANAGLDLEMPGPPQWFGAEARRRGARRRGRREAPRRHGAPRARRSSIASGALDAPDPLAKLPEESVDDPIDRDVARRAASGSFVLLQNRDAALPLDRCARRSRSSGRTPTSRT